MGGGIWGPPLCPKFERDTGGIYFTCLKMPKAILLFQYFEYIETISLVYMFELPHDSIICLLGVLDVKTFTPVVVLQLLYFVRKKIAHYLMSAFNPTKKHRVDQVNCVLIQEMLTYQHSDVSWIFIFHVAKLVGYNSINTKQRWC